VEIVENKWITQPHDIAAYFMDMGNDYLPCGQGYYTDEASVAVKIDEDYFIVQIQGEQCSSKQDRGDRLYWIEEITSVTFKPTTKKVIADAKNIEIYSQITKLEAKIIELKKGIVTI